MPKALCLTALVISILVFLLFFSDFLLSVLGMESLAPFRGGNEGSGIYIDLSFSICAAILGFLSFMTLREQV